MFKEPIPTDKLLIIGSAAETHSIMGVEGDPEWPEELDELVQEELITVMNQMQRIQRWAKLAEQEVARRIGEMIGKGGWFVDADRFYRYSIPHKRVLENAEGLKEWVGQMDAFRIVKATDFNITSIRALAEERKLDAKTVENTFYGWDNQGDELKLSSMPLDKAPAYARKEQ